MNLPPVRIAVLDMYNGEPNEGMRSIKSILEKFSNFCAYQIFDVRKQNQIPDTSFDIYISSGGPGNPLPQGDEWENPFFNLWDEIIALNKKEDGKKKFVFFICHSFQMLALHLGIAKVCKRNSPAFGIFPIHKTDDGNTDSVISRLPEPFFGVDSREWQVTESDHEKLLQTGAKILCMEKIRPHVPFERAVMAIRFSKEMMGVQFHPEADAEGMYRYFERPDKKVKIIEQHGKEKYESMIALLANPNTIELTHHAIIPSFLSEAIEYFLPQLV